MFIKSFEFLNLKVDGDDRIVEGYASTFGNVDRGGDIVVKGAFTKTIVERMGQVKVLNQHFEPIGKAIEMREDDHGLWVKFRISKTTIGDDVLTLLRDGVLDSLSIGFEIVRSEFDESGNRLLLEVKLFEFSVVTFPMNEEALITAVKNAHDILASGAPTDANGLKQLNDVSRMLAMIASDTRTSTKSTPAFADLPLSDRDAEWDGDAAELTIRSWAGGADDLADMDWSKYSTAFFWFDQNEIESLGSYKLGFAEFVGSRLVANWAGVTAAASALQGARGGLDIPDDDIGAVRAHIERYYAKAREQFDDETIIAPWAQTSGDDPADETKDSPVLSQKNIQALTDIASHMKATADEIDALVKSIQPPNGTGDNDPPHDGKDGSPPTDPVTDSDQDDDDDEETKAAMASIIKTIDRVAEFTNTI